MVYRVLVEKKEGFRNEAEALLHDGVGPPPADVDDQADAAIVAGVLWVVQHSVVQSRHLNQALSG